MLPAQWALQIVWGIVFKIGLHVVAQPNGAALL